MWVRIPLQSLLAWSSGKLDKYEYLTGWEILPSNQRQIREQTKFCFWKASKNDWRARRKTSKNIWRSRRKNFLDKDQKSIASLFSKDFLNEETLYELKKIVEVENKLNGDYLIYKTGNKIKKIKRIIFKSLKQ